jgi:hypothetical protein
MRDICTHCITECSPSVDCALQSLSEDTAELSQNGLLNPGKVVQADT